jgi:ADP-ribose pyrophosphatase YjhB (NUDIX family)
VVPSTTAVVTDDQDRMVLIRRRDNDLWASPGGGWNWVNRSSIPRCAK